MNPTVKKLLIISIILILCGSVISGIGLICGADWNQLQQLTLTNKVYYDLSDYEKLNNEFNEQNCYSVSVNEIDSISVDWLAGRMEVRPSTDGEIHFSEAICPGSTVRQISEKTALRYGIRNGQLIVQYCDRGKFQELPQKELILEIPADLPLESLKLNVISCDITARDLTTTSFIVNSISGNVKGENIAAENALISATSGDMNLSGTFTNLNVDTVSGKIMAEVKTGLATGVFSTTSGDVILQGNYLEANADSVSGEISLTGRVETLNMSSASGDLTLETDLCPEQLQADSTSGNVKLTLPEDSGFTMDYDTVSGELRCELLMAMDGNKIICGSGENKFEISTTSGDLHILK